MRGKTIVLLRKTVFLSLREAKESLGGSGYQGSWVGLVFGPLKFCRGALILRTQEKKSKGVGLG